MDFSKYRKTPEPHVVRIRRSDMAVMRMALEASGDKDFFVGAYSGKLPLAVRSGLPQDTDRRHGVVSAHYAPADIMDILENARLDRAILDRKAGQDMAARDEYEQNKAWLGGTLPVGTPAEGKG